MIFIFSVFLLFVSVFANHDHAPQCGASDSPLADGDRLGCLCLHEDGSHECISEIVITYVIAPYNMVYHAAENAVLHDQWGCHDHRNGTFTMNEGFYGKCREYNGDRVVGFCNPNSNLRCCMPLEGCDSCTQTPTRCDSLTTTTMPTTTTSTVPTTTTSTTTRTMPETTISTTTTKSEIVFTASFANGVKMDTTTLTTLANPVNDLVGTSPRAKNRETSLHATTLMRDKDNIVSTDEDFDSGVGIVTLLCIALGPVLCLAVSMGTIMYCKWRKWDTTKTETKDAKHSHSAKGSKAADQDDGWAMQKDPQKDPQPYTAIDLSAVRHPPPVQTFVTWSNERKVHPYQFVPTNSDRYNTQPFGNQNQHYQQTPNRPPKTYHSAPTPGMLNNNHYVAHL